jgi:hypothetical protein
MSELTLAATVLLWCSLLAGSVQGASTRIAVGVTLTNTPANSNVFLLQGQSRQWRTNATNSALQFQITNSIGGNRTNFYSQILANAYTNNVEVFYGAASNVVVLQGQPGQALTASLSGSWGYLTFYTNPVSPSEAVFMPFTEESTNTRTRIANGMVSALNSNAVTKFDRTALPLSYYINDSTAQGLSNKTLHAFKGRTGEVAHLTVTNQWVPSTGLSGEEQGRLRFVTANNDPEGSVFFDVHPMSYEFPYPTISDGASNFFDIVDFAAEGFETNRNIMTLGVAWRYFPKLDTVPFYGFAFTNRWGTSQIFSNVWGSDVFVRFDMPVTMSSTTRLSGPVVFSGPVSSSATWTNLGTIKGGTISGAAIQDSTLSNVVTVGGAMRAAKSLGNFDVGSDIAYTVTNFTSLANGNNIAVDFGSNVFVRLAGSLTADGSICGIVNGRSGKTHMLFNDQPYTVFLAQTDSDPVVTNRFWHKWTSGNIGIPPYGWGEIVYDMAAQRWTVENVFPFPTLATNAFGNLDGSGTNGNFYASDTNHVPLTVTVATNQYTNAFQLLSASGSVLWSLSAAGVPSFAGASVITVLSNGVIISGSATGLNFVGSTLITNASGTVSVDLSSTGGGVSGADLTAATNNVTTNAQAHLTASNAIAIARANQVGTDGTNALTTATNNVTTNTASLLSIATNNVTTNLYQRLTDSNAIAIARANQVGTDATNALTTATNNVTTNTASLLSIATNNVTTNLYQRLTDSNGIAVARANQVGTDLTNRFYIILPTNGVAFVTNGNTITIRGTYVPGANTTLTTNGDGTISIASAGGGSGILTNLGTGTFTTLNSPTINNASNITTAGVSAGKLSLSSTNAAGTTNTAALAAPNILNSNYTLTLPKDGMKGNNVSIFVVTNVSGGTNIEGLFPALSGLSFDGATLTAAGGGGGGSSGLRVTNVIASTTNFLLFDLAQYDVFKVYALTNFSYMFTNSGSLSNKAYVYFQQDTNGSRLLNSFGVYGGTIQTNASMQPTTNANALDVMEVLPGFFTTNLVAYWPQNFQPRVAFTNSLAGGGGGGGGPAFGSMVGVTNAPSSSSTTQAITATNAAPQNSRVVVAVSFQKNASTLVSSITDTGGNTYVRDRATTNTDSGVRLDLWSSDMAAGALSVGNSITVTYNEGVAGGCFLSALYLTGTTGVDVSTNFFGIANGTVSCVRSTTAANVAVGFADSENVGDVYTPAWTTGAKANMGNEFEYHVYKVNASSGALDLGGSTSTAVWFACIWVAYK